MNAASPFCRRTLLESEDFRRILALPRRTSQDLQAIADRLTDILRVTDRCPGTHKPPVKGLCSVCQAPLRLKPIQGQALYEGGQGKGAFLPIRVGGGKTLLSLLFPFVLGARRPLLLLPAALKDKTERERNKLANHWRVAKNLRLLSYEELGREGKAEALTWQAPDVIIADEAHRLKNKKAGVTRRVVRYMRTNPKTKKAWEPEERPKFFGMSGTMLKGGTIKSFAHLLKWSHQEGAPIPLEEGELEEWCACLDEAANFVRPHPGPLLKLATEEDRLEADGDDLRLARMAFHRRLVDTPGVVSTAGEQVACSLYIRALPYRPNAQTEENFKTLRGEPNERLKYPGWYTPDGWPLTMAAEVWRVSRELALGFHGVWDPRPKDEWMNARKNWAAFVRKVLSHSRTLDTELQVAKACAAGQLSDLEYNEWVRVKDSFRIIPKDVWHDDTALNVASAWLAKGPGIAWVDHVFFGDELERRTGCPYFREGGLDKRGQSIETLAEMIRTGKTRASPIIASIPANATGRNLQPWSRNLITSCPSSGATWEQLLGRTHRDGQEADQVEVDVMIGCVENFESWENARAQAEMARDSLGDSQKILIADPTGFVESELARGGGYRWTKTSRSTGAKSADGRPWWEQGEGDDVGEM